MAHQAQATAFPLGGHTRWQAAPWVAGPTPEASMSSYARGWGGWVVGAAMGVWGCPPHLAGPTAQLARTSISLLSTPRALRARQSHASFCGSALALPWPRGYLCSHKQVFNSSPGLCRITLPSPPQAGRRSQCVALPTRGRLQKKTRTKQRKAAKEKQKRRAIKARK